MEKDCNALQNAAITIDLRKDFKREILGLVDFHFVCSIIVGNLVSKNRPLHEIH